MQERKLSLGEKIVIDSEECVVQQSDLTASQFELAAIALRTIASRNDWGLMAEIKAYMGSEVTHGDLLEASKAAARQAGSEKGTANSARESIASIQQYGLPR
jgi:hypothetical protein